MIKSLGDSLGATVRAMKQTKNLGVEPENRLFFLPKSSILVRLENHYTIHSGVPLFLESYRYQ